MKFRSLVDSEDKRRVLADGLKCADNEECISSWAMG